ncbi:hypothetical protein NFI96_019471 [Prochilodus magdalenae]|nr:hypothetical protein NFI96_019471 [Prochilodus magdalenae]
MSYSRRVASWLISLPARFVQACARGAKLEMISVWLLFLKLLRATAGVKRPNGSEINEGRKDSLNQQQKEQEYLSEAVAMETSQLSEMADLKDYKMDLGDTEEDKCQRSEEDGRDERHCLDAYIHECLDTEKNESLPADEHKSSDLADDCASSEETERRTDLQDNAMVKETRHMESNLRESDANHQDQPAGEGEDISPSTLDANGTEHEDLQESRMVLLKDSNTSTFDANGTGHQESQDCLTVEPEDKALGCVEEHQEGQESPTIEEEDNKPSNFDARAAEHQEPQDSPTVEDVDNNPSDFDARAAEHQEPQDSPTVEEEDNNPSSVDGSVAEHQVQDSPPIEDIDNNPSNFDARAPEHQESRDSPTIEEVDNSPPDFNTRAAEHQEPWDNPTIEEVDNSPPDFDASAAEHQESRDSPTIDQVDNNPSDFDASVTEHQKPQDSPTIEEEDNHPSEFDVRPAERQEPKDSPTIEEENNNPSDFDAGLTEHQEPPKSLKVEQEDNVQSPLNASETDHQESLEGLKTEQEDNRSTSEANRAENQKRQESPTVEQESVLEQQIKELVISEASTESCHDNDRDDLSDCLQVEMAIVSSDSDADEQWQSMFPPVVGQGDENGDIRGLDPADVGKEPNNQEDAAEEDSSVLLECSATTEDLEEMTGSVDILEQPECPTECELEDLSYESIHYHSLTKIPEDEEDLNQNAKHSLQRLSASTSELDKKLPQDFSVPEEARSENVSTEHLDFKMARQQWKKMEEQNKGQSRRTSTKQGTCQGGHSFMYTPVRTLDRPKKDQDSDSLSLGDYQYTQFSPCSEDSGLDDTSYRSPYDEPETPVEREIRETMEREESFRRERAISRSSSGEPLESKPRPTTLLGGRLDPEERRRMFNTPEDRCRSQRSPSARTPTFSVTASPSSKPNYHEMVANNVIILEPDAYPESPRHRGKGFLSPGSSRFHEWPSDMSNVIILETSNLIIRSASEFCLSTACQETQESTFHNNPFFKLRSHSTQSLVDQEIKVVRQRDEEFRRQRAQLYTKEKYDTVLVSPSLLESFNYDRPGMRFQDLCCEAMDNSSRG